MKSWLNNDAVLEEAVLRESVNYMNRVFLL